MVYRIHFTVQDLARTRLAEAPMPLHELELAARALQSRSQPARLDAWRHRARAQLSAQARMALTLMPAVGYSPGFISPARVGAVDELLEHVRGTPRERVRTHLLETAHCHPSLPAWTRHLADDASLLAELCTGLSHLYTCLLAPYWAQFTESLAVDRTLRLQQFLTGGVEQLLTQANPQWMRWKPPVLEIRMVNGADGDLYLDGEGFLLIPSMFCTRAIVTEGQPASVSYPVSPDLRPRELAARAPVPGQARLSSSASTLLGRTRTTVLATIAEHQGCSTKELAARAGIAPASASEHATILREAGLIRSLRHRNSMLHSPTPLGLVLLNTSEGG
ncbi:helix-turn-helix transcriptional regulator [Streptomyces sp. NBC_00687]|uniref:ArsR/SmtB family transcription factor n=1 Tax=Streptomyces sp. NBC_00687 TaxID=2975807 RepID=UPI00224CC7C4|nr:winged helix-turn-helix domain-containing protein [Streptomyces sp. NBC_00687]MCX4912006.1 helix-turn-helix domain-containing protein [Streptomyces sp. NBC_00687]